MVAMLRKPDPKKPFVWHNAGMNGTGGSSYIDAGILRDRDLNSGWTASGDGTLEERVYFAQNWRADVSVVLSDTGKVKEWVKYSSYGVPFSITPADFNGDGFVNGNDDDDFDAAYNGGAGAWDARVDLDLDGTLDSDDDTAFTAEFVAGEAGGYRILSRASLANRLGYAGYQHAPELPKTRWHVRYRVLDSETGRWMRRDPWEYLDSMNLFTYVNGAPTGWLDPYGLIAGDDCVAEALLGNDDRLQGCTSCCKAEYDHGDVLLEICLGTCQDAYGERIHAILPDSDPNRINDPPSSTIKKWRLLIPGIWGIKKFA